jgi:asparagine synthase (glutamine-hydrolysing)
MCGIYGFIGETTLGNVINKLSLINYRGPDFSLIYNKVENVFLGHNRLAVLDLDARANQPFEFEHLVIVFNGEIYNYNEIKSTLIGKYDFKTKSDTEVIAAAYLEFGEECVKLFNGMFSFVIFNKKDHVLFGARDRLGKKPFFYRKTSNSFEFSSQISPILNGLENDINWLNVQEYFFWGYNQSPNTFQNGVLSLEPGCSFNYYINTKDFIINKYWGLDIDSFGSSSLNFNQSVEYLNYLLEDSVRIRNIADVSVGVFLSGGIDSSLITALAQKTTNAQINTFSIGFNENEYDESSYAKSVAKYLNTNHHSFVCDKSEVQDFIINIEKFIDQPLSDPSYIPSLLLSKKTSTNVTVALSGDGGDELFLGYNRYDWVNKTSLIPFALRYCMSNMLFFSPNYKHKLLSEGLRYKNDFDLYCKLVGNMKPEWINFDYNYSIKNALWIKKLPLVARMGYFDVKTYLLGDINTKVDLSSMRFSLETRAPLLDYRVAEFANTLPQKFKFDKSIQKRILKNVLYKHIPSSFFDRPKAGFAMPLKEWFRTDLKEFVLDTLTDNEISKIPFINRPCFKSMINKHMNGTENNSLEIWKTIVWLKIYNNLG